MWSVIFQLHFHSWLFCYHLFAVYRVVIYVHTVYINEHFPFFLYTHGSLSDDPRFDRSDIGRFIFIDQVFDEKIPRFTRSWSSLTWSLFLGIILLVFIHIVSMILCIGFILVLFFYSSVIMCGHYMYSCSDYLVIIVDIYSLFGLL